jgi:hypothetical protein
MGKIVVSTWHRLHHRQQFAGRMGQRIRWLEHAVAATDKMVQSKNYERDGLIRGIFAAPEYFFAGLYAGLELNNGSYAPRSINAHRHEFVLRNLLRISAKRPRILIIPGTIAWKQSMNGDELRRRLRYYEGRAANKPPLTGDELTRALKAEYQVCAEPGFSQDVCDATEREQFQQLHDRPMRTRAISDAELSTIQQKDPAAFALMVQTASAIAEWALGDGAASARKTLSILALQGWTDANISMMSNMTYALLNGRVVFCYSKQGNFHEEQGDVGLVFVPGGRSGVAEIEGLNFGLEICLDHNMGILSRQLRQGKTLDVQIILSDFVYNNPGAVVVRDGGYVVHASTHPEQAGVWQKNGTQLVKAPSLGTEKVWGTDLSHWLMDIDVFNPFELAGTFMETRQPWRTVAPATGFRSRG